MAMSVPDPDEMMDTPVVDEPIEEHEFDISNANEMDDDFGNSNASPFPVSSNDEQSIVERPSSPQLVNSAPLDMDLDYFANNYKGFALMNRLVFVADVCPPMQLDALLMLRNYVVENTANVPMYMMVQGRLDSLRTGPSGSTTGRTAATTPPSSTSATTASNGGTDGTGPVNGIPQCDTHWVETTMAKAEARLEALSTEFKRQKDEGVKESTRRAMDELFQHQVSMGLLQDAAKLYGRGMREYCTAPKHVIQMHFNWIEVSIYLQQWHRVEPLISHVERAIVEESEAAAANASSSRGQRYLMNAAQSQSVTRNMKELIESSKSKIAAISAIYRLHSDSYKAAAEKCLQVDLDCFDYPMLIASKDIALCGTICALATFERNEIKEKVLWSPLFRKFLESEPRLVELIQKFCKSEFAICFDILDEIRDQLLLNIFMLPHVRELYRLIRRRAIVQYFAPYSIADLGKMAVVFRTTVEELGNELVDMIESGDLCARIDSPKRTLVTSERDYPGEFYEKALSTGRLMGKRAQGIVLRSALQQAQICVGHVEAENGHRGGARRRPAGGHVQGEEFGERTQSKLSGSNGGGRSFMWRIFGAGKSAASQVNVAPSVQAAEADSSNKISPGSCATPEPPNASESLGSEGARVPEVAMMAATESEGAEAAAEVAIDEPGELVQSHSMDEQGPPPVPVAPTDDEANAERRAQGEPNKTD